MLKSNKGISLISAVVYVIVLIIAVTLLSNFSGYFYKNIEQITINESDDEQFTRFLAYLTKDIKQDSVNYAETGTEDNVNYFVIKFKGNLEHQYLFKNKTIYYIDKENNKKISLCKDVSLCDFTYNETNKTLNIFIMMKNKNYSKILVVNSN